MKWLSRTVTLLMIAGIVTGAVFLVRAGLPKQNVGQAFHTHALLRDGSRLALGAPVVIAGVRVGEIEKLSVEGHFARVDLLLRNATDVPRDSWITKRAASAFGDSYLEIIPPDDEGAGPVAALQDGEALQRVIEGTSTDAVLRTIGRAMPRVDSALDSMHTFLGNGRHWVDSAMQERATDAVAFLDDGKIEAGISSADRAMQRLDDGTARAATAIDGAGPQFKRTLDRADTAIANARGKIADVRSGLHDGLERVRTGLDSVDQPIADYKEVVEEIDQGNGSGGRGTLGRLINDPEPGIGIDDTVQSVREAADGLARFKTWIGLRFEYNVFAKLPRIYATAELRSKNDKYYLIELERDSLGGYPDTELSESPGAPAYTRTVSISDQLRFSFQFGKQFGWLGLRGGIKESTFGIGADGLFYGGRLRFAADAFGGLSEAPRLKFSAAFAVFRSMYVTAGIDDPFTKPGYVPITKDSSAVPDEFQTLRYGRDYFVGAGLHFDDDDLAILLRVYGALIIDAL